MFTFRPRFRPLLYSTTVPLPSRPPHVMSSESCLLPAATLQRIHVAHCASTNNEGPKQSWRLIRKDRRRGIISLGRSEYTPSRSELTTAVREVDAGVLCVCSHAYRVPGSPPHFGHIPSQTLSVSTCRAITGAWGRGLRGRTHDMRSCMPIHGRAGEALPMARIRIH